MVFDRNAINTGRRMQDFGLCDLQGVYQNTAKMRGKGFLVVAFVSPKHAPSVSVARALNGWTEIGDKVSIAAVCVGERADAEALGHDNALGYPVLWDFETYTAPLWAVSAVPALFIMDDQGLVLGRVLGADPAEIAQARELLATAVRRAADAAQAKADAEAQAKAQAEAAAKATNNADPKQGGAPGPVTPSPSPSPAAAKA